MNRIVAWAVIAGLAAAAAAPAAGGPAAPRDILFADLWLTRVPAGPIAVVYAAPSRAARVRGTLVAVPRTDDDGRLRLGIDVRQLSNDQSAWIYNIGDRGEAATVFVLAQRGAWIQLPADPFPSAVWLELNQDGIGGAIASTAGRVFGLAGGIRATHVATGRSVSLDDDRQFMVERISGGEVLLREGRSGAERYSVMLSRLFDLKGRPLLWPVAAR